MNSEMRKENQILLFLFILLQCHIGHALKCESCIGDCTDVKTIECPAGEDQCMTRKYTTSDGIQRLQKGCLKSQECNASNPDPTLITHCCNTDLCNAASTTSAPTVSKTTREPGTPLHCRSCDTIPCLIITSVVCKPYHLCVTQNATILGLPQKKYGCANATICSKLTTENSVFGTVTFQNNCCNKDLCNLAVTLKLPSFTTIGAVLLLWITKVC